MPWLDEHLAHGPEEAVGRRGEPADTLDGFGDEAGHVAGAGHVDELFEVVDAGLGVGVVVEVAEGAAEPVAALHEADRQPREAGRRPRRVRR